MVTRLRVGVTRKASNGAGSCTVTQLRGTPACVCVGARAGALVSYGAMASLTRSGAFVTA